MIRPRSGTRWRRFTREHVRRGVRGAGARPASATFGAGNQHRERAMTPSLSFCEGHWWGEAIAAYAEPRWPRATRLQFEPASKGAYVANHQWPRPLSKPTTAVRPWRRNRSSCPHSGPCRPRGEILGDREAGAWSSAPGRSTPVTRAIAWTWQPTHVSVMADLLKTRGTGVSRWSVGLDCASPPRASDMLRFALDTITPVPANFTT